MGVRIPISQMRKVRLGDVQTTGLNSQKQLTIEPELEMPEFLYNTPLLQHVGSGEWTQDNNHKDNAPELGMKPSGELTEDS